MSSEDRTPPQKIGGDAREKGVASQEVRTAVQKNSKTSDQKKGHQKGHDVNQALQRAYKSTIDEAIPPSMLDLLSKLD